MAAATERMIEYAVDIPCDKNEILISSTAGICHIIPPRGSICGLGNIYRSQITAPTGNLLLLVHAVDTDRCSVISLHEVDLRQNCELSVLIVDTLTELQCGDNRFEFCMSLDGSCVVILSDKLRAYYLDGSCTIEIPHPAQMDDNGVDVISLSISDDNNYVAALFDAHHCERLVIYNMQTLATEVINVAPNINTDCRFLSDGRFVWKAESGSLGQANMGVVWLKSKPE